MKDTASLFTLNDAFVVITDYERYSVVLSWDSETHDAPKVIAKKGDADFPEKYLEGWNCPPSSCKLDGLS